MSTFHLLAWGANSHGQLSLGNLSEQCIFPQKVDLSECFLKVENVKKIVGGAGHTLILDTNGHIYSCGWNNRGQTGHPEVNNVLNFKKINGILEKENVVDVACGWDTSAALTKEGIVFLWGSNYYGQLGKEPSTLRWSYKPIKAVLEQKVKKIAIGLRHIVFVTQNNTVIVGGAGSNGQLGLSNFNEIKDNNDVIHRFTVVPELNNVSDVSCGQYYTVIITKSTELYVFGANKYGQLGIDSNIYTKVPTPTKIINVNFKTSIETYAGWTHTAVLNEGTIVTWGRNSYGQLGYNGPSSWKPKFIENIPKICQLSIGSQHNIALTDTGSILCWGWNEHANCGNGSINDVLSPEYVSIPPNSKGILVGTGAGNSFAVIKQNS